jgi:dynein heavy chain 2
MSYAGKVWHCVTHSEHVYTCPQAAREPAGSRSWVVCDGDVDPEWIESLNSVLDDNRWEPVMPRRGWGVAGGVSDGCTASAERGATHPPHHAAPSRRRLLTLPNGERIQFGSGVNFLFECSSLAFASPATVSR